MLFKRVFAIQKYFSKDYASQKSRFPTIRTDDVSSRPDAHLSTVPAFWKTCHTVRTPDRPSIIRLDDVNFCPDSSLYRETSVPACIRPDVSAALPDDVQWSISFIFYFHDQIREDWCNRPDNVDSRLDVLIHKARIAFQIQPFGRQSALSGCAFNRYGNCEFNFNRLDACLSWSGRALIWYGNCMLKINRPDGHPLGPDARTLIWKLLAADVRPSGRQYLTVRMLLSNRKDFQQKS
jgi:hypothetical protein